MMLVGLPITNVMLQMFAAKKPDTRNGTGSIPVCCAREQMIGVTVRMTMSLLVTSVRTLENAKKYLEI
jgi:hypothetical protein